MSALYKEVEDERYREQGDLIYSEGVQHHAADRSPSGIINYHKYSRCSPEKTKSYLSSNINNKYERIITRSRIE